MTRWGVPIQLPHKFSDIELNRWLHLFDSPDCKVTQVADGSYYLTACRLEKLGSDDEVKESANKLVTMMTAIAKIEMDMDFQSIGDDNDENVVNSIQERVSDTSSNITTYPKPARAYMFALVPTVEIRDEHGNIVTQPRQARWYDRILDQCDGSIYNKPEFTALSYFAQKTEARTVRLTYETIQDDEGDDNAIVHNGWVSQHELKRFTCSVNRQDIDSPELHPKVAADPKCTMNIGDARTFCAQKLLKPWLIKKTI